MVEQRLDKALVVGSNPAGGTKVNALLVQRLVFRFCSPAMAVRVRHGAPGYPPLAHGEQVGL